MPDAGPPGPAVTIGDILSPRDVVHALRTNGKRACLDDLSRRIARTLDLEAALILSALLRREDLGSTGIGGGVGLPHARIEGLTRPFGLLATLRTAIDYAAIDDRPVDLVVLLLLPADANGAHLDALACVSRRLRDPAVAAAVRGARSANDVYAAMCGARPAASHCA